MTLKRLSNKDVDAWSAVLATLAPQCQMPERDSSARKALMALEEVLSTRRTIPPDRITPEWLSANLVEALRREAQAHRAIPKIRDSWYNGPPGRIAKKLAETAQLKDWISERAGRRVQDTVNAVYIYYDAAGHHIPLHVDYPEEFEYNLLICLDRRSSGTASATTTMVVTNGEARSIDLAPGQALLFHSSYTPHGRTPLAEGEAVTLISLGFSPMTHAEPVPSGEQEHV